jgi:hypothetical protein
MRRVDVIELWGVTGFLFVMASLLFAALFIDE